MLNFIPSDFLIQHFTMSSDLGAVFEYWYYVIAIIGFPLGLVSYLYDAHKDRQAAEEEIHERMTSQYMRFLELVVENADLGLLSQHTVSLTAEQTERKLALYNILIAVFEEGYILNYEPRMSREEKRRWQSWHDFIAEWCRKEDFRQHLPRLLEGEDQDFVEYVYALCADLGHPISSRGPK